jgi:hypothetical protein
MKERELKVQLEKVMNEQSVLHTGDRHNGYDIHIPTSKHVTASIFNISNHEHVAELISSAFPELQVRVHHGMYVVGIYVGGNIHKFQCTSFA